MKQFTKEEIEQKIREARGNKLEIEGIYYVDEKNSWTYSVDTFTLAVLMSDVKNGNIHDIYYFKCTKLHGLESRKIC